MTTSHESLIEQVKDQKLTESSSEFDKRYSQRTSVQSLKAADSLFSATVDDLRSTYAREKALPFEPLIPNQTSISAMREARLGNFKSFDTVDALMADLHAED